MDLKKKQKNCNRLIFLKYREQKLLNLNPQKQNKGGQRFFRLSTGLTFDALIEISSRIEIFIIFWIAAIEALSLLGQG